MAETGIKLLHSGTANKDPNKDLGGEPSVFEIAVPPMNNLYDDVRPDELANGTFTDYRCFYIRNRLIAESYRDITVTLTNQAGGSDVSIATQLQTAQQYITVFGIPETNGYIILKTDWGMPVTCYYTGSWAAFATELQTKLRFGSWMNAITVILDYAWPSGNAARFRVGYDGYVTNRRMKNVQLIQNNFFRIDGTEYQVAYSATANTIGNSTIFVSRTITDHPQTGILHVQRPSTGLYVQLNYISYSGQTFTLSAPLAFSLLEAQPTDTNSSSSIVWLTPQNPQPKATVEITNHVEGYPIGQISPVSERDTDLPAIYSQYYATENGSNNTAGSTSVYVDRTIDTTVPSSGYLIINGTTLNFSSYSGRTFTLSQPLPWDIGVTRPGADPNAKSALVLVSPKWISGSSFALSIQGIMLPGEGAYVWTRRVTSSSAVGAQDQITLAVSGTAEPWPYVI